MEQAARPSKRTSNHLSDIKSCFVIDDCFKEIYFIGTTEKKPFLNRIEAQPLHLILLAISLTQLTQNMSLQTVQAKVIERFC